MSPPSRAQECEETAKVFIKFLQTKGLIRKITTEDGLKNQYNLNFKHEDPVNHCGFEPRNVPPVFPFESIVKTLYNENYIKKTGSNSIAFNPDKIPGFTTFLSTKQEKEPKSKSPKKTEKKKKSWKRIDNTDSIICSVLRLPEKHEGFPRAMIDKIVNRVDPSFLYVMNMNLNPAIRKEIEISGYGGYKQNFSYKGMENSGFSKSNIIYYKEDLDVSKMEELEKPQFQATWLKFLHKESVQMILNQEIRLYILFSRCLK